MELEEFYGEVLSTVAYDDRCKRVLCDGSTVPWYEWKVSFVGLWRSLTQPADPFAEPRLWSRILTDHVSALLYFAKGFRCPVCGSSKFLTNYNGGFSTMPEVGAPLGYSIFWWLIYFRSGLKMIRNPGPFMPWNSYTRHRHMRLDR